MKKSEKEAKRKLREKDLTAIDHVPVVSRRGARLEYNQGQAVKQSFGSGIRDIVNHVRNK